MTSKVPPNDPQAAAIIRALLEHFHLDVEWTSCDDRGCRIGLYQDGDVCPTCFGLGDIATIVKRKPIAPTPSFKSLSPMRFIKGRGHYIEVAWPRSTDASMVLGRPVVIDDELFRCTRVEVDAMGGKASLFVENE